MHPSDDWQPECGIETHDQMIPVLDATLRVRHFSFARRQETDLSTSAPLIFLHEGLGCVEMWKDFPPALCAATGRPGLAYDRQGYGRSSPFVRPRTPDYLHTEAYTYFPALLQALGISRAILIGHSDGGSIALLFASAFPERVCCLTTIAAHVFVEPETVQGIAQAKTRYQRTDWPHKLAKYHKEKTDDVFYAWTETWLSSEFAGWNIERELVGVSSPALVMQGVDDVFGTAKQVDSIVCNTSGPALPCWIADCGHAPHLEAPEQATEKIRAFIAEYAPRT
ncbi:alpha/beta fold hydrolase [Desulfovermiculus halophilus]|jgi:pimeloyl-ACP methyl ester carboxylesterase|uniref:alpha/beta fold hydrolase n=1 Tax=Desulfovermiculus halophilus TaxID=339722 RepID=UPI000688B9F0|nr:alpha/beta hydrolase [Desulfovermiculus halophilus]